MRDFIISTESNADLTEDFISSNDICVIPHYYTIEEQVYGEEQVLTDREFYDAMRMGKSVATMASNPAVIQDKFTRYAKEGKDVLHISFSSELSGGCGNVIMAANEVMEEYPDMQIVVVDTLSASLGEMLMIVKALELKKAGKSIDETKELLERLIPHICVQFTVDDLNHLYRGGRLSKTSALIGTMMDVKPILHINMDGKLVALSKTRGRKKSMNTMINNMIERLGEWKDKQLFIGILHGDCEQDAGYLEQLIREKLGDVKIVTQTVGPSIGAHSGPGTLGLVFMGDYR
ncbi:MAG: DegV family protein [Lachnospiraceae bacterium]|jgi:DegV family protein with EDD domain|nr:DegV family protein [Lachnospiraceae bacterium]